MLAGEKVDPKENLPGGSKGQARDKAAESVGMSGRTAEKLSVGRTLTLSLKTRPVSGILLKKKATGKRKQRLCGAKAHRWEDHSSAYRLANAATQRRTGALPALPALRHTASSRLTENSMAPTT
jgi:hypothetical protein